MSQSVRRRLTTDFARFNHMQRKKKVFGNKREKIKFLVHQSSIFVVIVNVGRSAIPIFISKNFKFWIQNPQLTSENNQNVVKVAREMIIRCNWSILSICVYVWLCVEQQCKFNISTKVGKVNFRSFGYGGDKYWFLCEQKVIFICFGSFIGIYRSLKTFRALEDIEIWKQKKNQKENFNRANESNWRTLQMLLGGNNKQRPPRNGMLKNAIATVLTIQIDSKKTHCVRGARNQKVYVIIGGDGSVR